MGNEINIRAKKQKCAWISEKKRSFKYCLCSRQTLVNGKFDWALPLDDAPAEALFARFSGKRMYASSVTLYLFFKKGYSPPPKFMSTFDSIYVASFPYKTVGVKKRLREPWVTRNILAMIRENKYRLCHTYLSREMTVRLLCSRNIVINLHPHLKRHSQTITNVFFMTRTKSAPHLCGSL